MGNPIQITKTGLVPVSSGFNYKTNYMIPDTNIGKYISLSGARTFYNPGIGLTLSAPTSAATSTTLTLTNFANDNISTILTSPVNGDSAFFYIFNTLVPQGDTIPGFVNAPAQIIDASFISNLSNIQSVVSQGNHRVLNVIQDGTYTFTFTASGAITQTSGDGFHFDFGFYLNINGNETLISPGIATTYSAFVGGNVGNLATLNFNYPTFTQTYQLKAGDYVQLYGKGISDIYSVSCRVNITSSVFTLSQTTVSSPKQTTFSNPLNITPLNINSINYYGANRDTLLLQGNKLTS